MKILKNIVLFICLALLQAGFIYLSVDAMYKESQLNVVDSEILQAREEFAIKCVNDSRMNDENFAEYCKYMQRYIVGEGD